RALARATAPAEPHARPRRRRRAYAGRRQQGQATPGLHAARDLRRRTPANVRVLQRRRGMRWPIVGLVVALLVGGPWLAAEAQTPSSLTVQVSTEPPGLDLTATPASATAAVAGAGVALRS